MGVSPIGKIGFHRVLQCKKLEAGGRHPLTPAYTHDPLLLHLHSLCQGHQSLSNYGK